MNADNLREKMQRDLDETKNHADRRRLERDYLERMERGWDESIKSIREGDKQDE